MIQWSIRSYLIESQWNMPYNVWKYLTYGTAQSLYCRIMSNTSVRLQMPLLSVPDLFEYAITLYTVLLVVSLPNVSSVVSPTCPQARFLKILPTYLFSSRFSSFIWILCRSFPVFFFPNFVPSLFHLEALFPDWWTFKLTTILDKIGSKKINILRRNHPKHPRDNVEIYEQAPTLKGVVWGKARLQKALILLSQIGAIHNLSN